MRRRLCVCALLWLFACKPADEIKTAKLSLRALPSCELPAAPAKARRSLRATGDFRARELSDEGAPLELPESTEWLGVELLPERGTNSAFAGGLLALRYADVARDVLLLPLDVHHSCPLYDPLASAGPDTALSALPGGGLLIAGGRDANGTASSRAFVLQQGAALFSEVGGGMVSRRAGATATAVGTRVVVAGGGPNDRDSANETFEIYDATIGRFESVAARNKLALGARRDHAAARLGDGRVLIVGGRAEGGADREAPALASAELIDPLRVHATPVDGELAVARIAPQVVVLDSGTALVALGLDASGNPLPDPPLERFDGNGFAVVATLPTHAYAAVAALEGERMAYVGCDGDERGCQWLVFGFDGGSPVALRSEFDLSGVGPLTQPRLLALHDGRVLLSGRDPSPNALVARQAFLIDPTQALVSARCDQAAETQRACVELSRVPEHLVELDDGTVVELDALGVSLRRADVSSELDDPPELLIDGRSTLFSLDESSRFLHEEGARLTALQDHARLDLPHLRFADVRVELTLEHGSAELLFEPERRQPAVVALGEGNARVDACALASGKSKSEPIVIERHGDTLQLGGDRCPVALEGRVGLALRLASGTSVRGIKLTRL